MSKYEDRIAYARKAIESEHGKTPEQMTSDELILAMLKFSESNITWRAICRALALTNEYKHGPRSDPKTNEQVHRMFQKAVKPGLDAGLATRISEGFYSFA